MWKSEERKGSRSKKVYLPGARWEGAVSCTKKKYSWQLEERYHRMPPGWLMRARRVKVCWSIARVFNRPYLCGTISKVCQIAGPRKRGLSHRDRDGCSCRFCSPKTKDSSTVHTNWLVCQHASPGTTATISGNIQHPTFDIQSQQCDSEKLAKAALHMDRDKYRE